MGAGQVADFAEFAAWANLILNAGSQVVLALSFHAIGPRFRGLIGVVAFLVTQDPDPILLNDGTFLINYAEDFSSAQSRFSTWLERVIVEGLNQWRRTL